MTGRYAILIMAFLAWTTLSCARPSGPDTILLRAEVKTLDLRHPEADLRSNITRGSYKFIGVSGLVGCVPLGTTPSEGDLIKKHGIRCIEGTRSDAFESKEYASLIGEVAEYASAYNSALVAYLRSHPVP